MRKKTLSASTTIITIVSFYLFLFQTKVVSAADTYVGKVNAGPGFAINLGSIITTLLSAVMAIAALATFGYLMWGSVEWIMSGGEKGKAEQARTKITTAVIGLFVLAATYAIFRLVLQILGFESLTEALTGIKRLQVGQ